MAKVIAVTTVTSHERAIYTADDLPIAFRLVLDGSRGRASRYGVPSVFGTPFSYLRQMAAFRKYAMFPVSTRDRLDGFAY